MNNRDNQTARSAGAPKGLFLLALLAGFMTCFGVVTAIGANGDADENLHTGGPVTERVVVESGTLENAGPWKLYHSKDAQGKDCYELGVISGPPEQRGEVLYGGCGSPPGLNVGTLTPEFGDFTVVRGNARRDVARVELEVDGGAGRKTVSRLGSGAGGDKVFAVELPGRPRELKARALDADGRVVATQNVPLPSGAGGH